MIFSADHFADKVLPKRLNRGFANLLQWVVHMGNLSPEPHVNNLAAGLVGTIVPFLVHCDTKKLYDQGKHAEPVGVDYCLNRLAKLVATIAGDKYECSIKKASAFEPFLKSMGTDTSRIDFGLMETSECGDDASPTPEMKPIALKALQHESPQGKQEGGSSGESFCEEESGASESEQEVSGSESEDSSSSSESESSEDEKKKPRRRKNSKEDVR